MIDYLIGYLKGAKRYHDLDIRLIGAWNEKFDAPAWVKAFRKALDENGFSQVGIVGGDMNGPPDHQWRIADDGAWQLSAARAIIASGRTAAPGEAWQRLGLRCVGDRITALPNGAILAEIHDPRHPRGLVGISSGFHPAGFDNLDIRQP